MVIWNLTPEELIRFVINSNYINLSLMLFCSLFLYYMYKISKINIPMYKRKIKNSIIFLKKPVDYSNINYKNLPKDVLVSGQVSKQSDTLETNLGKKAVVCKELIKKRKRISTHYHDYQKSYTNKKSSNFILTNTKGETININSGPNFNIDGQKTLIKLIRLNDDNPEGLLKEQGSHEKRSNKQILNYIRNDKGIKKEEEGIMGYSPNSFYVEEIIKPKDKVHIYGKLGVKNGKLYIEESDKYNKLIISNNYSSIINLKNFIVYSSIIFIYIILSILLLFTFIFSLINLLNIHLI
jgi:hypothetical protein